MQFSTRFFHSCSNFYVFSFTVIIRQARKVISQRLLSLIPIQYLSCSISDKSSSYSECPKIFLSFSPFPSASNPCEKNDGRGPCSHLCLINYNRTASCTCPHLMKLSPNKQSCFGEPERCPHFSCFLLYVIKVNLYYVNNWSGVTCEFPTFCLYQH